MLCNILKPFTYSSDGVTAKHTVVGHPCNIPRDLVPGLVAEGYVKPAPNQPVPAQAPKVEPKVPSTNAKLTKPTPAPKAK